MYKALFPILHMITCAQSIRIHQFPIVALPETAFLSNMANRSYCSMTASACMICPMCAAAIKWGCLLIIQSIFPTVITSVSRSSKAVMHYCSPADLTLHVSDQRNNLMWQRKSTISQMFLDVSCLVAPYMCATVWQIPFPSKKSAFNWLMQCVLASLY